MQCNGLYLFIDRSGDDQGLRIKRHIKDKKHAYGYLIYRAYKEKSKILKKFTWLKRVQSKDKILK